MSGQPQRCGSHCAFTDLAASMRMSNDYLYGDPFDVFQKFRFQIRLLLIFIHDLLVVEFCNTSAVPMRTPIVC